MFVVLSSFVLAADSSFYFKRGSNIDLKIPCFNLDNSYCDNETTNCTTTINYPDGLNLINNNSMTYQNTYYNYSIDGYLVNQNGEYATTVNCVGITDKGKRTFGFTVNFAGKEPMSGIVALTIMIFVLLITIAIFLLPKFVAGQFSKHYFLNLTIVYGCYLTGLYLLTLNAVMVATISDTFGVGLDSEVLLFVWIFTRVTYFAMVGVMIKFMFVAVSYLQQKRMNQRMGYDNE